MDYLVLIAARNVIRTEVESNGFAIRWQDGWTQAKWCTQTDGTEALTTVCFWPEDHAEANPNCPLTAWHNGVTWQWEL